MNYSLLQDNFGKRSSKRLFGALLLLSALIISVFALNQSFNGAMMNTDFVLNLVQTLIWAGSSLIGAGTLENFARKNATNIS